jgi:hypothetical protein
LPVAQNIMNVLGSLSCNEERTDDGLLCLQHRNKKIPPYMPQTRYSVVEITIGSLITVVHMRSRDAMGNIHRLNQISTQFRFQDLFRKPSAAIVHISCWQVFHNAFRKKPIIFREILVLCARFVKATTSQLAKLISQFTYSPGAHTIIASDASRT